MGKNISIYLDEKILRLLDQLATEEQRSRSNMIAILIVQEAERRNLSVEKEEKNGGG